VVAHLRRQAPKACQRLAEERQFPADGPARLPRYRIRPLRYQREDRTHRLRHRSRRSQCPTSWSAARGPFLTRPFSPPSARVFIRWSANVYAAAICPSHSGRFRRQLSSQATSANRLSDSPPLRHREIDRSTALADGDSPTLAREPWDQHPREVASTPDGPRAPASTTPSRRNSSAEPRCSTTTSAASRTATSVRV
jgi:hypothetical protein